MLDRLTTLLGLPLPSNKVAPLAPIPAELAALNHGGLDWRNYFYDGGILTLAANNTLAYGHSLELRFHGVSYLRCPTTFDSPCFRAASTDDLAELASFLDLTGQTPYFFDALRPFERAEVHLEAAETVPRITLPSTA
jgi:hypothetical protein